MAKISNVFGTTFSGRIGKKMIASSWKGHEYIRTYVKPRNPNTRAQREARGGFADAVKAWQQLSDVQHAFYDKMAAGMSGFNLFISRYVSAVRDGDEPETPAEMRWKTADGRPVEDGELIILKGKREVFRIGLEEGRAEAALAGSDAPYMFVLAKGGQRDAVLRVKDMSGNGMPEKLESEELGITLIAED